MERKEAIRGAYRMTGGNSFYDGMITCSTLSGKVVCRLVWAMNKAENDAYLEKALSGIPEHFSGKLLEVPVGTGILTMPVYQTMPEADITCLDYSPDMMRQAREKADRLHLKNVTFRQGDVGWFFLWRCAGSGIRGAQQRARPEPLPQPRYRRCIPGEVSGNDGENRG